MKKITKLIVVISFIFIVGCSSDVLQYEDDEVAAIVRGEEITIGDLRFLYPDNGLLDKIEGTARAKLVVQEAKRLNIELSEEAKEQLNSDEAVGYEANKEFAQRQARKFDMDPEEYYRQYEAIANEMIIYMNAYVEAMTDVPPENVELYNETVNKLLNDLFIEHRDEIEILIKK